MAAEDRVAVIVEPLVSEAGLEVYDVTHEGGVLRVVVDRPGGVGLDDITGLTRQISAALDEADPIGAAYTLEVSSPGLERRLRRPQHFAGAIGTRVKVKTVPGSEGDRRAEGTIAEAGPESFVIETSTGARRIAYDDVQRAQTVFEWGAERPEPKRKKKRSSA